MAIQSPEILHVLWPDAFGDRPVFINADDFDPQIHRYYGAETELDVVIDFEAPLDSDRANVIVLGEEPIQVEIVDDKPKVTRKARRKPFATE
jgi:hypothetical protein